MSYQDSWAKVAAVSSATLIAVGCAIMAVAEVTAPAQQQMYVAPMVAAQSRVAPLAAAGDIDARVADRTKWIDSYKSRAAAAPKPAAKAAPAEGPKKGSMVKVKRPESYWYNQYGKVITVDTKAETRYPVMVRFDKENYAGIATNNFAVDELEF
jgi:photosystem I subunit 4|eukprot:CAMPEP_0174281024 /NCGR_PEP_ID=MMETSP0809-20121228/1347_1 /TAXON_ID=73025 ORGANISM="Eutreptiella gymnastica-like, Strain CCMP1594" /NCGR_SAMPLE_ID=MMETSP0809 /ASSEMBLY_ACC=CAM_ASM_000658 /LENGTH=153 /DNA_ID=CAMNT_0015374289 /DNA_START=42 /DNA_END=503 /DNA_ORIENTATION=-